MAISSLKTTFETIVSDERAKLLAILISQLKDIELAEDALQEAFIKAWTVWKMQGIPDNPNSWILKTAYNKAIDVLRRQQNFNRTKTEISQLFDSINELKAYMDDEQIKDERLKLIFTCCHPALDQRSQVALVLNTLCGFNTEQVAGIFLLKTPALAQRLVRAKRKIKRSGIPFQTPETNELPTRLASVLSVIYLIHNQGYYASDNTTLMSNNHNKEAVYLAKTLNQLLPQHAEILGLLALMYFHMARLKSRAQNLDQIISLEHQDRKLWDQNLIEQANDWFKQAIKLKSMGPYQIQAAISGVHSQAKKFEDTDWQQIVLLYTKLYEYQPTAIVQINQAVALSYNKQAGQALRLLQKIDPDKLNNYLPFYLAKAHILKVLGKKTESINYFSHAIALSKNTQEIEFLKSQLELINN